MKLHSQMPLPMPLPNPCLSEESGFVIEKQGPGLGKPLGDGGGEKRRRKKGERKKEGKKEEGGSGEGGKKESSTATVADLGRALHWPSHSLLLNHFSRSVIMGNNNHSDLHATRHLSA